MSSVQHQLSQYLQYELYHILGAYGIAETRMRTLADELEESAKKPFEPDRYHDHDDSRDSGDQADHLRDIAMWASRYNWELGWYRHCAGTPQSDNPRNGEDEGEELPRRDPIPGNLPLTSPARFDTKKTDAEIEDARVQIWSDASKWRDIPRYYSQALKALRAYQPTPPSAEADRFERRFADGLLARRDSVFRDPSSSDERRSSEREARCARRINRYEQRLQDAIAYLSPPRRGDARSGSEPSEDSDSFEPSESFLGEIVSHHLSSGPESLPIFVVRALAEAHLSMHAVEAWQSMCLGREARILTKKRREWLDEELRRCMVLNTFAYCVSRTAPWIFAADEKECAVVLSDSERAWETVVPARGIWIANQVSLLALHRRAYARALQDDADQAYNDYHKLQRLIRDAERRVRAAPIHVDGAIESLGALDAQAHHHIGELYRREHAHRQARRHFAAASHRLESVSGEAPMKDVLANSRWYVALQISHGKTSYEMGRHKEALCWILRGWSAFLKMLAADTYTQANVQAVSDAIEWLERVAYEPEVSKAEVRRHLGPVVEQLKRVTVSRRYKALAGEILLRLGHLLFVIDLEDRPSWAVEGAERQITHRDLEDTLAFACLLSAAEHDPYSTLIEADRLKALFRFEKDYALPAAAYPRDGEPMLAIDQSWPRGDNDYERIVRTAEYLLLRAQLNWKRSGTRGVEAENARIARELLLSFFMNTDSINVRKSQVHRLLMRKSNSARPPAANGKPAIEFVCMRRYSSMFPLLPRPSAFRALGGGYFVRLHPGAPGDDDSREARPFGIVIDPGVDFVENLYRTGYSLSDINMVVVTHDHVDHVGGLDALISLCYVRSGLLRKQGDCEGPNGRRPLMILASESVETRYRQTRLYDRSEEFRFAQMEKLRRSPASVHRRLQEEVLFPAEFELVPLSTKDIDKRGHRDLSGKPAFGMCFRERGGGKSIAIAGDAPKPPEDGEAHEQWISKWAPALSADILVAHLSSVPLTELRQLADPRSEGSGVRLGYAAKARIAALDSEVQKLEGVRRQLEEADADRTLKGQVEWGMWLRSKGSRGGKTASVAYGVDSRWDAPSTHAFLRGTLTWARAYRAVRRARNGGLFIVGELSEDLGSMRGRVASNIHRHVFKTPVEGGGLMAALSADIGLRVFVVDQEPDEAAGARRPRVKVLCTACNLDTDRVLTERYHKPCDIFETCVKGENEGIFYNCREHAPGMQNEPVFLEQLERFDIFGR